MYNSCSSVIFWYSCYSFSYSHRFMCPRQSCVNPTVAQSSIWTICPRLKSPSTLYSPESQGNGSGSYLVRWCKGPGAQCLSTILSFLIAYVVQAILQTSFFGFHMSGFELYLQSNISLRPPVFKDHLCTETALSDLLPVLRDHNFLVPWAVS